MRIKIKYKEILFLMVLFAGIVIAGCDKEDEIVPVEPEPQEDPVVVDSTKKDTVDYALKKAQKFFLNNCFPYYYWYDEMDSTVKSFKLTDFKTIYSFFEATLYSRDRWSWMADGDYFAQSETGEYEGTWGASLVQQIEYYNNYDIRVAYVFPGSPFAKKGVKRGWILTEIDGRPVMETIRDGSFYTEYYKSPQTFTFAENDGTTHTFIAELANVETNSYLKATVFQPSDFPGLSEPVGYFNYLTFNAGMLDDINDAMTYFKAADIHKLILDLRYNGGGDLRASQLLVNYLAPQSANGKVYVHTSHNKYHTEEDKRGYVSRMEGSLDLDALYVIGGDGTASASELVINGLKPFLDVTLVGDTTYGKPNGMYVFMYPGTVTDMAKYNAGDYSTLKYVFLPICFYNKNGEGETIPEDGFIPDNYRPDDLKHDFGVEEDNIKACLTKIVTGSFPDLPAPRVRTSTKATNTNAVLRTAKDNPLYGLTIEPFPGQLE